LDQAGDNCGEVATLAQSLSTTAPAGQPLGFGAPSTRFVPYGSGVRVVLHPGDLQGYPGESHLPYSPQVSQGVASYEPLFLTDEALERELGFSYDSPIEPSVALGAPAFPAIEPTNSGRPSVVDMEARHHPHDETTFVGQGMDVSRSSAQPSGEYPYDGFSYFNFERGLEIGQHASDPDFEVSYGVVELFRNSDCTCLGDGFFCPFCRRLEQLSFMLSLKRSGATWLRWDGDPDDYMGQLSGRTMSAQGTSGRGRN